MTAADAPLSCPERVVTFGPGERLVGILTSPPPGAPERGTAVLLLNAGVVHRVGPQRLWVKLARRFAADGFTAFRFDHGGLGDSLPREDQVGFEESSILDLDEAMAWLETHAGIRRFAVLGLCSGTLTAFRAAQRDPRVVALLFLTALLEDPSGVPEDVVAEASGRRVSRSYVTEKAGSGKAWRRLLSGQVNVAKVARSLLRAAVPRPSAPLRPATAAVIEGLEQVLARKVPIFFLFPEPSTVREYFRMTVEDHLRRLRRRGDLHFLVLKGADHTFTQGRYQERVTSLTSEWLTHRCS